MKKYLFAALLFIMISLAVKPVTVTAESSTPKLSATEMTYNIYNNTKSGGYYYLDNNSVTVLNVTDESTITCKSSSKNLKVEKWEDTVSLYPKKKGNYTVTIEADGKTLSCKVNVVNAYFARNKRSFNDYLDGKISKKWIEGYTTLTLYPGETQTLKVKGISDTTDIKWSSSDKSVAKVNKTGKVTAKNYGYADIYAQYKGITLTYKVGISYKTAIKALRYAEKYYNCPYSQPKRMQKGYYDCSSYVWRSYASVNHYIGGDSSYAPTAANLASWAVRKGYMIMEGDVDVSRILPGDLIFWTGANNGRYKGIYHVDFYTGNYSSITVHRSKFFGEQISKAMVARPCLGSAATPKGASSVFSNHLTWSQSRSFGANSYDIYRSTSKTKGFKKIGTAKNKLYYDDSNVTNGKKFYYKIIPYWKSSKTYTGKGGGVSKLVKKKKGSPASVTLSSSLEGVKVSWEKVEGATGYQLFRWESSKWKKITTIANGKKGSYVDTKANKGGTTYKYSLRAVRKKEQSGYAKQASIKFIPAPDIDTITNVLNGIELKWSKVSGISMYRLYRKEGDGKWTAITDVNSTSYVDSNVEPGTDYKYSIQCLGKDGESTMSGYTKSVSKFVRVETPEIREIEMVENGLEISWESMTGAVNYAVYRKVTGGEWKKITTTTGTTYLDTSVQDGIEYEYRVWCVDKTGTQIISGYREDGVKAVYHKINTQPEDDPDEEPDEEPIGDTEEELTEN